MAHLFQHIDSSNEVKVFIKELLKAYFYLWWEVFTYAVGSLQTYSMKLILMPSLWGEGEYIVHKNITTINHVRLDQTGFKWLQNCTHLKFLQISSIGAAFLLDSFSNGIDE